MKPFQVALLAALLAGCGKPYVKPDPETLVGTRIGVYGETIGMVVISWEEGDRECSISYTDDVQARRILRKWLEANYPEGK